MKILSGALLLGLLIFAGCKFYSSNYSYDSCIAGRGCCSSHGGVCGCSGGRSRCCDGTLSPSCQCFKDEIKGFEI